MEKLLKKKLVIDKIQWENIHKKKSNARVKGFRKMIEFKNVQKKYNTGTVAVEDANFVIEKGEFAFLVGTSREW